MYNTVQLWEKKILLHWRHAYFTLQIVNFNVIITHNAKKHTFMGNSWKLNRAQYLLFAGVFVHQVNALFCERMRAPLIHSGIYLLGG